jgi:hypothetical protein
MKLVQVEEMPKNQSFITAWTYNGQLWSELNIFEEGFEDGLYVLKRYSDEVDEFIEIVDETRNPDTEFKYYIQD